MAIDRAQLLLKAHQSLVYNITGRTRAVFLTFDEDSKQLLFLAYYTQQPSEYECELLSDAACETAVDFPEIAGVGWECIGSDKPFAELEKLDYWLFARAEELDGPLG